MAEEERTLEHTPTWALAAVVMVFVIVGLLVITAIDLVEKVLKKAHKKALVQTVYKMKEELMLLGFISLIVTVFEKNIEKICVKDSVMDKWNPCPKEENETEVSSESENTTEGHDRRLLSLTSWSLNAWARERNLHGRILAEEELAGPCKAGYSPLLSAEGLELLHLFIFVLALAHLFYTLNTIVLAVIKVRGWKKWEEEAQQSTPQGVRDMAKSLTLDRNRSFVEHHTGKFWQKNPITLWISCFLRQFGQAVTRSDYLSLRDGFIKAHNLSPKYNFHNYMLRSMDLEFKHVTGISPYLWIVVILSLLFNLDGVNLYFYLALVPVVLLLAVGAKLQQVIAKLALDNAGVIRGGRHGDIAVKPRDDLFWFNNPSWVLTIIRFILFENSFELTAFVCFVWAFGFDTCLLNQKGYVYARLVLGIAGQIMCGYSTLPLYSIVTQMGSSYKPAIFPDEVRDRLHGWRRDAKGRVKLGAIREGFSDSDETVHRKEADSALESDEDESRGHHDDHDNPPGDFPLAFSASHDAVSDVSRGVPGPSTSPWPLSRLFRNQSRADPLEEVPLTPSTNSHVEIEIARR